MLFIATKCEKQNIIIRMEVRNVDASKAVGYKECLRARIDIIRFKIDYYKPLS